LRRIGLAYNRAALFIICLLLSLPAFTALKDPTRPAKTVSNSRISTPDIGLILSAIMISSQSKYATINGITAKEGQLIPPSIKVLKIDKNSVKIQYKGVKQTLYLLKSFKKNQVNLKKSDRNE